MEVQTPPAGAVLSHPLHSCDYSITQSFGASSLLLFMPLLSLDTPSMLQCPKRSVKHVLSHHTFHTLVHMLFGQHRNWIDRLVKFCKLCLIQNFCYRHDFLACLGYWYYHPLYYQISCAWCAFKSRWSYVCLNVVDLNILSFTSLLLVLADQSNICIPNPHSHDTSPCFMSGGTSSLKTVKGSILKNYLMQEFPLIECDSVDFQFVQCVTLTDLDSYLLNNGNLVPFHLPLSMLTDFLT